MVGRHETRAEKQAFVAHLSSINSEDRLRIMREQQAFLNGERSTDADFSSLPSAKQKKTRVTIPHDTVVVTSTDILSLEQSRASEVTGARAAPLAVLDAAATTTDERCTDEKEVDGLDSDCDEDADELMFVDEEDAVAHDPKNNVDFPNVDRPSIEPAAISESADEVVVDEAGVGFELDEEDDFDWHFLQPEEMLELAKDEASLARMRKYGWQLGPYLAPVVL
ncbi:uncharacterized protein PITG_10781 [Phytophthora infestans T30-4]|uniref:Uncharacterized protein n=1 Tax=Phytophthora infestans (strain T30-4) TaxID=403677 RepID=D0NH27_PHYIT|nr:uncharacterized protein PITG_10781 [Phytophthora infestans T30-4]EEY58666.1 conserved hypothetical protein [Phytophthora infestans T30-4]|eukprot:XP_002901610.1 conserved hypothetical protein [Phytophthora infestans T30-4]